MNVSDLTTESLRTESVPMRLYEKAKDGGGWNPAHLDLSDDKSDWKRLQGEDRVAVLALTVLGAHGLRSQLRNSAGMLAPIEQYGTIEESLCYSSHIYETARHIEFHTRLLEEIFHLVGDPERFHLDRFESFFGEKLPDAVGEAQSGSHKRSLVEAMTLTGPLAMGVLGMTRRRVFTAMLERLGIMPTVRKVMRNLRRAAGRHSRFKIFFIGRLLQQEPSLWEDVDEAMNAGFEPAVGMIREFFETYHTSRVTRAEAVTYAVECFSKCYEQLERAKEPTFVDHQPTPSAPHLISP